jgi:dihydroxy-acid dehydratase
MTLRSSEWFDGTDEVDVMHRVVMRSVGFELGATNDKPVIGIADSSSMFNPCNLPLRDLVSSIGEGVTAAGGLPMAFPIMSLGEDLMKPTAMLYRSLLSMEVEEYVRSNPIDGLIVLGNCDKSIPGGLMGALSTDIPTLVVNAGGRPVGDFRGRRIGTGTDLWRAWEDRRAGVMDDEAWAEFERCLNCGLGACNTMGTASSMAVVTEVLGFMLPGSSTAPSGTPERTAAARAAGERIVGMVRDDVRPSHLATTAAFANAAKVLNAIGGSTNVVLHMLAMSRRTAATLELDDFGRVAAEIPVLADIEPSGSLLIQDFHAAGGVPALVHELGALLDLDVLTASGRTWAAESHGATPTSDAIRSTATAIRPTGAFSVVRGSLAPRGALIKTSAASPELFDHTGPAFVFRDYEDMLARIEDPDLPVTVDSVLVLSHVGPVAVGMPEWGMIPIPAALAASGVRDMVRVTDSRMSGTSFGTCVLHAAPEAAIGGPLALVENGDLIHLDVAAGRIDLLVDEAELLRRREAWTAPVSAHLRGWPLLYQRHVTQADEGCDLDFLQGLTEAARVFVPPIVGRS